MGDLLDTGPPITKKAYEEASYDAIEKARLHLRLKRDPEDDPADHFVDDRLVACVTPDHRNLPLIKIRTCYHKHFGEPYNHIRGEHRSDIAEQRLLRFLRWFENLADANRWNFHFYKRDLSK